MKTTIWATFKHKCSTDALPQHDYCPRGEKSWCTWRVAEAAGTLPTYHHKPALTPQVQAAIKPVYESLSEDDWLERCTGGNTQNCNESLNSCVWRLSPKHLHSGAKTVELATNIACNIFNDGHHAILKMMELLGLEIGLQTKAYA